MGSPSANEYAKSGVDYRKIEPFKQAMIEVGTRTLDFPKKRDVEVLRGAIHSHGGLYRYFGYRPHIWCVTQEGLGNKSWIAEYMYKNAEDGRTYYEWIGWDAALMAVNDVIAQGAMPVVYTDEVAVGDDDWFKDEKRARDLANSYYEISRTVGMALPAGESPALRYLLKSARPVKSAPSLSGSVVGIIAPSSRFISGAKLSVGDIILGALSSGVHCNGLSLVIKRAKELHENFLTKLPTGRTLGEESLLPTVSYVGLVEALLEAKIDIHALLPATGSGLGKIAYDKRPFTYRVHSWVDVPPIFRFMRELGVSLSDCLVTFNWGIGYYVFVPREEVNHAKSAAFAAGCPLFELGIVEKGERKVIFEPGGGIILNPPGE